MRGSGNRMRELREAKKLSQRQLAEQVGTSQQQIQRIETGLQAARIDVAVKIAKHPGRIAGGRVPGAEGGSRQARRIGSTRLDARS